MITTITTTYYPPRTYHYHYDLLHPTTATTTTDYSPTITAELIAAGLHLGHSGCSGGCSQGCCLQVRRGRHATVLDAGGLGAIGSKQ